MTMTLMMIRLMMKMYLNPLKETHRFRMKGNLTGWIYKLQRKMHKNSNT